LLGVAFDEIEIVSGNAFKNFLGVQKLVVHDLLLLNALPLGLRIGDKHERGGQNRPRNP